MGVKSVNKENPSVVGRNWRPFVLWLAPVVFLAVFYFFPLGTILTESMSRSQEGAFISLIQVLTSSSTHEVIWFTLWQALLSTILTFVVGLPGAYLFARYTFIGKTVLRALMGIPFVLPTLVVAAAFNALLGPRGWINLALMDVYHLVEPPIQFSNNLIAILVAHVFYNTAIVLRMVGDFWSHIDPRLDQAARSLGATRWQALRRVTLPLLFPAISSAALLVFIFNFTSFGVILLLGGPRFATLEVEIYYQTISLFNLPTAAVLSVMQLLFTLVLTWTYTRLSSRMTVPLQLRSRSYTQQKLSTWRRKILAGILVIFLLSLFTVPLIALASRSFARLEPDRGEREIQRGFTLDFYKELQINRRGSLFYTSPITSIAISLGYAIITVAFTLILGLPASWALAFGEGKSFNRFIDPILMLPLGTSAVTLGLGFIIALDQPPLDLRASPLLIPIAHTLVALPFVVRSLTPALRSIQPRIRHAAVMLGAKPIAVFRHIDLPLVGRAVFVAAMFAFTISMGEFGATALVGRPEYPTIPVAIYRFISQPGGMNYGQALALSTILMVITMAGMLVIDRFRIADIGEF